MVEERKHNVSRNLFIGLGGTGSKILIRVRKSLIEKYGEIPPSVQFLILDTDIEMNTITETARDSEVHFDQNEMVHIPIQQPHRIMSQDHIQAWLADEVEPLITPSANGARQIRSLGRFAFVENYSARGIGKKITDKIESIRSTTQINSDKFNVTGDADSTMIHMVFSPCGGTGAGTFVDVVMALRSKYEKEAVYAWMVMPDVFKSFPFTQNVTKNAYAALMEIDHLQGKDRTDLKPWSNYDAKKAPYVTNPSGTRATEFHLGQNDFFNYIYLFDKTMMEGSVINDDKSLYDRIGKTLFFHVTDAGDDLKSLYNNNDDFRYPANEVNHKKRRNYSSMGLSQLVIDRNYLSGVRSLKAMNSLITSLSQSSNLNKQAACDSFIDANGFREDRGEDDVIDALFQMSSIKYSVESIFPGEFEKGCNVQLKDNSELFLNSHLQRAQKSCTEGLEHLKGNFANALQIKQNELYNAPGGLVAEKQFLNCLIGAFKGMKDEMFSEATKHTELIQNTRKILIDLQNQIIEEENSYNPFGRSSRIKAACTEYAEQFGRIVNEELNKKRKQEAESFFDFAIAILENELKKNHSYDILLAEIFQNNETKLQALLNAELNTKDFEIQIHEYLKAVLDVNKDLFGIAEAYNAIDFLTLKNSSNKDQIINVLNNFVKSTELITEIEELELEELLNKLPKTKVGEIVSRLDRQSEACIKVNTDFCSVTVREAMTDLGMILVPNKDNTIFNKDNEVVNYLANKGNLRFGATLKVGSTYDRDRITFLKIKGMFPACAIHNIGTMKADFDMSVERGGYHFSDVYFQKHAMDLIQGAQDKEILKLFAVGSALKLIGLERGAIRINVNGKIVPIVEGARDKNNRAFVFECFAQNPEWQNLVKEHYEGVAQRIDGGTIIAQHFKYHFDNIDKVEVLGKRMDSIVSGSAEYNHIFSERDAIKQAAIEYPIPGADNWGNIDYGSTLTSL